MVMMSCTAVALEGLLDPHGNLVVTLADKSWIQQARGRGKRVHGRIQAVRGSVA
jgi:hypothetical protein